MDTLGFFALLQTAFIVPHYKQSLTQQNTHFMKKEHYTRPEAVVVGMETESDILQGSHEEESDMTLSMENGLGGEGVTHENPTEILGKGNNNDVWDTKW